MDRRIAKVRFKEGRVEIKEVEEEAGTDGTDTSREIFFKCAEPPAEEFEAALKRLAPHVRTILELPADYCEDRIEITGASFSLSKGGIEGAVISGYVKLDTAGSPFSFNTPHLSFAPYDEQANQPLMPDEAQADLIVLRTEVQAYLDGKRAQADLFDGKAAAAGEGRDASDVAMHADLAKDAAGETTVSLNGGPAVPISTVKAALSLVKGGKLGSADHA
jgi:hypothetical protein